MKVTAFIGTESKKHTYNYTAQLLAHLATQGSVDYEIVRLSDYSLKNCRGCKNCLDRGEEFCPLQDDRDILIDTIIQSDGIIFSSPNYSFQVSGIMKSFLDRLGYFFHRPQFFGKSFGFIVTQGVYGGKDISKYFRFIGKALGCTVVNGVCLTTREPMSPKRQNLNEHKILQLSNRYYQALVNDTLPIPGLFDLIIFRITRTTVEVKLDPSYRDYQYYRDKGWFNSDFYYPARINVLKKTLASIAEYIAIKNIKSD